jgi:hypothetical protein
MFFSPAQYGQNRYSMIGRGESALLPHEVELIFGKAGERAHDLSKLFI